VSNSVGGHFASAADTALEATIVGSWTSLGFRARRRLYGWQPVGREDAAGKVVVITGATSGLGKAAATRLAGVGAHLVLVGRDQARTNTIAEQLRQRFGNDNVEAAIADLADLGAVETLAQDLLDRLGRLDSLVHNAGALTHEYTATDDGIELTFQAHVVAPFLLTERLLPLLQATPGSRVVTMSSGGMYAEPLVVDRVEMVEDHYDGVRAYARAKRAQVVLNAEWARRFPQGPSFYALHPGWADTPGVVDSLPGFHRITGPFLRTPDQGADTMVWLSVAGDVPDASGSFWLDRRQRGTVYRPGTSTSEADSRRLWDLVSTQTQGVRPTR